MPIGSGIGKFFYKSPSGGDGTYFGDGTDGSHTFDGTATDSLTAGASSYGRYFVDGSTTTAYPTPLAGTGVYQYTVPNKDGSYDGDAVVKQYSSLTINENYILTTDQPCRGFFIMVTGNCTINGALSMTARGANADPSTHGVATTGIRIPVTPVGSTGLGEDISTGAVFDGMGTAATNLETAFNNANGTVGAFLTVPKLGMPSDGTRTTETGSDTDMKGSFGLDGDNWIVSSTWGSRPTDAGKTGEGGGGRSRTSHPGGGAGSCFSGGAGSGGQYFGGTIAIDGLDFGGEGGNGSNTGDWNMGGGAGNPGGTGDWSGGTGGDGCGGLLILLVGGDLTIGTNGGVYSLGVGGSSRPSSGQYAPGSSSGGGSIVIGYKGTLTNNGTINVDGGSISQADNGGNLSYPSPQGGKGSYQLINLSA